MSKHQSKTVTMMQLRQHIGEVVSDVIYTNTTYLVEKHGKPICRIQPYQIATNDTALPQPDRVRRIERLFGSLKKKQPGEPDDWTQQYGKVDQAYEQRMKNIWKE